MDVKIRFTRGKKNNFLKGYKGKGQRNANFT